MRGSGSKKIDPLTVDDLRHIIFTVAETPRSEFKAARDGVGTRTTRMISGARNKIVII